MKTNAYVVRTVRAGVLLALSAMLVSGCQSRGSGQAQKPPKMHPLHFTIEPESVPCVHYVPPRDTLLRTDFLQFVTQAQDTIWVTCPPGLISAAETTLVLSHGDSVMFQPLNLGSYTLTTTSTACDTSRGPGPSVVVDSGIPNQP